MRFFNYKVVGALVLACVLGLAAAAQQGGRGFDKSRMDASAAACTDFYQFANGTWLKTTEIPAAFPSWGSFNILAENNRKTLHEILEESAKNSKAKRGSVDQKIGDYYATCVDEAKREAAGAKPLAPELARIDKIKSVKDVQEEVAHLHSIGTPTLFGFGSLPDLKNSSMVIGFAGQGGLSLPTNEYYTKDDDRSKELRAKFVEHMTNMFKLVGDSPQTATKNAQTVMAIQTRLAQNSRTPVQLRDFSTQYNKMGPADVAHPEFFQAMDKLLTEIPIADWKTYFRWHLITDAANALSSNFETESFNFYGKTLQGRKEQYPRWRRCVSATDAALGEALGQVYVGRAFTPEAKARMQTMVNNLIEAFRARVQSNAWMSDETRKAALAKLAAFKQKIGYPEKWIDYTTLDVQRDSYIENNLRAAAF